MNMNSPEFNPAQAPQPEAVSIEAIDKNSLYASIDATDSELQELREEIKRSAMTTPEQQERIERLFAKMDQLNQQLDRLENLAANESTLEDTKIA